MIIKTEGIVLKTYDLRETSRIAHFFTKEHGKVKGVLKGIRKDPRKFGSSLDKFTINEIVFYQYNKSDLHLISQCDLKQFFLPIREDYKRNVAANYILELVDIIMPVEHPNKKIYKLVCAFLTSLEKEKDIDKLIYFFQIKILVYSGFRPHVDACVKCGKQIDGRARFSLISGGLICRSCPTQETSFFAISSGTISSMLHIEKIEWEKNQRLGLTPIVRKELKYLLNNFLVYHLGKKIKAAKFL